MDIQSLFFSHYLTLRVRLNIAHFSMFCCDQFWVILFVQFSLLLFRFMYENDAMGNDSNM